MPHNMLYLSPFDSKLLYWGNLQHFGSYIELYGKILSSQTLYKFYIKIKKSIRIVNFIQQKIIFKTIKSV